jgi:hypothetical protein
MRLFESINLILEGYKEATTEFIDASDEQTANQYIEKYKDLVNRNIVQGQERNIDYWRKQGWERFKAFVDNKSQQMSMRQSKKGKTGKSITLDENEEWLIVIPLDKDASCFHGRNTSWCTTKPFQGHFESYFYREGVVLIYFIRKSDSNKWAIAVRKEAGLSGFNFDIDYFDKDDDSIGKEHFDNQTGLNSNVYINKAIDQSETIQKSRTEWSALREKAEQIIIDRYEENIGDVDYELEKMLFKLSNATMIHDYIRQVGISGEYSKPFMKFAVNTQPSYIYQFTNADESIKKDAVRGAPKIIFELKNPSKELVKIAVQGEFRIIDSIQNPDKDIQMAAVQSDGRALRYIDNAEYEVQLAAVQQDGSIYLSAARQGKITYADDPEIMKAALTNVNMYGPANLKYMIDKDYEVTKEMFQTLVDTTKSEPSLYEIAYVYITNEDKFKFNVAGVISKRLDRIKDEGY